MPLVENVENVESDSDIRQEDAISCILSERLTNKRGDQTDKYNVKQIMK